MRHAVTYLRSSKDRSDVSIDAQRRELAELARARGLALVGEYADAVESGASDQRPAFQRLLADMRSRDRGWSVLLMLDTSRLSRRRHLAQAFKHEARKRGVEVIFAKLPDMDPITSVIVESVFEAMDEVHSLMSREKGLAGMAENVRQGYRAGGRAPVGYRLERVTTGAIREGNAVTKSRLVPSPDAPAIAAYLKGRAAGRSGALLVRELGLRLSRTTLVGVEWRALTYAGHLVWNQHAERGEHGYKGGEKMRPREEWVIERNTHEALITDAEAEAILARLQRGRGRYRTRATYLLSGLLMTPQGDAWHGNAGFYRIGGRSVKADSIERAVLRVIGADLQGDEFARAIAHQARAHRAAQQPKGEMQLLDRELGEVRRRIARVLNLVADTTEPGPLLRKVEELERERIELEGRLAAAKAEAERVVVLAAVTEADARRFLAGLADDLDRMDRETLKDALAMLLERVELAPESRQAELRYRLSGDFVASPRGPVENPGWRYTSTATIPRRLAA